MPGNEALVLDMSALFRKIIWSKKCCFFLCRTRKRKFHGNRYSKQATEVPDPTSPTPTSPAMSPNIDSAASKKLQFSRIQKQEKFAVSVLSPTLEEHDISVGTSVCNCVVSYSVLQEMFGMTVYKDCLVGQMKIFDTQTRCGCASYLLLTCENCKISKQFWSVHGKFSRRSRSVLSRFQNEMNSSMEQYWVHDLLVLVVLKQLFITHPSTFLLLVIDGLSLKFRGILLLQQRRWLITRCTMRAMRFDFFKILLSKIHLFELLSRLMAHTR